MVGVGDHGVAPGACSERGQLELEREGVRIGVQAREATFTQSRPLFFASRSA